MWVDPVFFKLLCMLGSEWDDEMPPDTVLRFDYLQ